MNEQLPPSESSAPDPRGWHHRGYLPHFDGGDECPQFVTFRLADSLPRAVVEGWLTELRSLPAARQKPEARKRAEAFLDRGHGECVLRDPRVGGLVEGALLHFDGQRYQLHAWVVMPNHVHVLFTPNVGHTLSGVVHSWKSFTSKHANKMLGRSGQFWMEEYFDRFIRDEGHFNDTVEYIEMNPVVVGLCTRPDEWPFGSARRRPTVVAAATGTAGVPPASPPAT